MLNQLIYCPKCKTKLSVTDEFIPNSVLVACRCDVYPVIEGIIYMRSPENKYLVALLRQGRYLKTLVNLLSFSFKAKIFFWLTIRHSFLYKFLGFERFIRLLTFLDFPKDWAKYLIRREKIPSFFFSLLSFALIKNRNYSILDLCCGTGNLLPHLYEKVSPQRIIAIDESFVNLYLAKLFFSTKGTTFICADLDKGIPIMQKSINFLHMADGIHYLKKRYLVLKESLSLLKKNGVLGILHILNSKTPKYKNAEGVRPEKLLSFFRKMRYGNYCFISNRLLWLKIKSEKEIALKNERRIEISSVFNAFFSTTKLQRSLRLSSSYASLLEQTEIDYFQDPKLKLLNQ